MSSYHDVYVCMYVQNLKIIHIKTSSTEIRFKLFFSHPRTLEFSANVSKRRISFETYPWMLKLFWWWKWKWREGRKSRKINHSKRQEKKKHFYTKKVTRVCAFEIFMTINQGDIAQQAQWCNIALKKRIKRTP